MTVPAEVGQLHIVDQTFWAMFVEHDPCAQDRLLRGDVLLLVSAAGPRAFNVLCTGGRVVRVLVCALMAHTYCLHIAGAKSP